MGNRPSSSNNPIADPHARARQRASSTSTDNRQTSAVAAELPPPLIRIPQVGSQTNDGRRTRMRIDPDQPAADERLRETAVPPADNASNAAATRTATGNTTTSNTAAVNSGPADIDAETGGSDSLDLDAGLPSFPVESDFLDQDRDSIVAKDRVDLATGQFQQAAQRPSATGRLDELVVVSSDGEPIDFEASLVGNTRAKRDANEAIPPETSGSTPVFTSELSLDVAIGTGAAAAPTTTPQGRDRRHAAGSPFSSDAAENPSETEPDKQGAPDPLGKRKQIANEILFQVVLTVVLIGILLIVHALLTGNLWTSAADREDSDKDNVTRTTTSEIEPVVEIGGTALRAPLTSREQQLDLQAHNDSRASDILSDPHARTRMSARVTGVRFGAPALPNPPNGEAYQDAFHRGHVEQVGHVDEYPDHLYSGASMLGQAPNHLPHDGHFNGQQQNPSADPNRSGAMIPSYDRTNERANAERVYAERNRQYAPR